MNDNVGIKGTLIIEHWRNGEMLDKVEKTNTVQSLFKKRVAYACITNTSNLALDDLATAQDQAGKDGIFVEDNDYTTHVIPTTLYAGGDNVETYYQLKGTYTHDSAYGTGIITIQIKHGSHGTYNTTDYVKTLDDNDQIVVYYKVSF